MVEAPQVPRPRWGSIIQAGFGLVAGATFLVLVMRNARIDEVVALMRHATIAPLLLAFLAYAADFVLRAARFWIMLQATANRSLPLRPTIAPFIASFGISDILPLRVGDGFRVLWFYRRFAIPPGTIIGTMIVERILDLVTIVMLGAVSLALVGVAAPPALVRNFQLTLIAAFALGVGMLFAPALLCRLLERVFKGVTFAPFTALISALRATAAAVLQIGSWRRLLMLTLLSLALWLLESLVVIGAWISLGGSGGELTKPFVAFVFSTLGTLVPSLPGHFGSFEFFGMQAFTLAGVDAPTAAAVLLLAHLILWAPTALFGIGFLLLGAPGKAINTA